MKYVIAFVLLQFQFPLFAQPADIYHWLNHPNAIKELDSLIHLSSRFALQSTNYPRSLFQKRGHLVSKKDSILFENQIKKTAKRFFNDLAYGNQKPKIAFNGIPNQLYNYRIDSLINGHVKNNSLRELPNQLLNSSKEVFIFLNTLNSLQNSHPMQKLKIAQLRKAINEYRWLSAFKKKYAKFVLVNIPSTRLKSFQYGDEILSMKVILGRPARPTRTIISKIDQVIMNPYWYLPTKISIEEYLPKIKKDIRYLQKSHFQVFDLNYQPVDPFKINWNNLSANYFPYRLRENPHANSTLGYLKFEFYNPYLIYLHDTAGKQLFNSNRFFRSHGCVRLEKPFDLAKFILSDKPTIMTNLNPIQLSKNTQPKVVQVSSVTPLVIWYSLVDIDSAGKVQFYRDVYADKKD